MKFKDLNRKPILLRLIFSLSIIVFFFRTALYLKTRLEIKKLSSHYKTTPPHAENRALVSLNLQAGIGEEAHKSGIKKLLSMGPGNQRNEESIDLSWEGSLPSSIQFLNQLQRNGLIGDCERIHISGSEGTMVKVTGNFSILPSLPVTSTPTNPISTIRPVFRALWETKRQDISSMHAQEMTRRENVQRKELERQEKMQKEKEEANKLEVKKKELTIDLTLTGIVNNGKETIAFVNSRDNGGQTLMLRTGDTIDDALVTAIDEKKGEVYLDYKGQFQVPLKISSRSEGAAR